MTELLVYIMNWLGKNLLSVAMRAQSFDCFKHTKHTQDGEEDRASQITPGRGISAAEGVAKS